MARTKETTFPRWEYRRVVLTAEDWDGDTVRTLSQEGWELRLVLSEERVYCEKRCLWLPAWAVVFQRRLPG